MFFFWEKGGCRAPFFCSERGFIFFYGESAIILPLDSCFTLGQFRVWHGNLLACHSTFFLVKNGYLSAFLTDGLDPLWCNKEILPLFELVVVGLRPCGIGEFRVRA